MKLYLNCFLNIKVWCILLALDVTYIAALFEKYIFSDIGYLKWLLIAMTVDLATGITKVWTNDGWRHITSRGIRDTVSKGIQYGSLLVITHVLTHFTIGGEVLNSGFTWVNKTVYEFLILIETKSVYENLVRINPKLD